MFSRALVPLRRAVAERKARRIGPLMLNIPAWMDGTPQYNEANLENRVHFGLKKNELIFACLQAKADTATSVSLKVYDRRTKEELPDHPLQLLIEDPNPLMSEADFWALSWIYRDLSGIAYWQKLRNSRGDVVELWPMRPDFVQPIPFDGKPIGAYEYGRPGDTESKVRLPGQDVLAFRIWDPINFYGGLAPVAVAARVADIDNAATDFIKLFWERGTNLPGVISSKLKLNDNAVSDIRRRLAERYGGFLNWLAPVILDSDASYQRTGTTFQEMGLEMLDGRSETRICSVLKVPPIIIGTTYGLSRSTFSNYGEARKTWWEDYNTPQYINMSKQFTKQMRADFGDDVYCAPDLSKVPAMQEERTQRWTRGVSALQAGGITRNDFRKEIGLDLLPPATGNVFLQSNMVTAVPADEGDVESAQPDEGDAPDPADETASEQKALKMPAEVKPFEQGEIDDLFTMYEHLKQSRKRVDA